MRRSLSFLCVGLILLSACEEKHKITISNPTLLTLSLNTAVVISQHVPRYHFATGYTNMSRSIEVSTSQAGTIKQLLVNEGDVIKAGRLLIVLDESELLTTIKQAKSVIKTAKITVKDRKDDFNTAKRLSQSKMIPTQQFRKSQVQLDLAYSQLEHAQNSLKQQEARKPYHRIISPINARVIKRWVNQGDLAVIGKPLLQLEALQGLEFETALPVQWINKIHIGDNYSVKLHNINKPIIGKVSHIIRRANRVTQTCLIKLSLPEKNDLTVGLSGQINLIVAKEKHLLIPMSSLIKKAGVQGVFRVNKRHQAVFTPVKIERIWQEKRIVLSGLQAGERVVLNPPTHLRDGTVIKAKDVVINER